jgi:low temperature requirement protein LtrA
VERSAGSGSHPSRLSPALRREDGVRPLELFFDLVFVLAITQCTALMAHDTSWTAIVQGLLVLGVLWWAWVGYAWLTSVIDPEEGAVRLVFFAAMAAMLIVALCVPGAFQNLALTFALAYGVFRSGQIALFILASPEDDALRHSVLGLAGSTAVAVGILLLASLFDGLAQGALWALALFLDMAGPYFFGSAGWKLMPEHFAERHGLIVIVALGESIVAIGVGASGELNFGIGAVAVLGVALASAFWWLYFDISALISARRLADAPAGRVRNELARDSYSYIHLLLVAGIVLVALGIEASIAHYDEHLHAETAFALLGGTAVYLIGLVSFRYRQVRTLNLRRLLLAAVLLLLIPVAVWALIALDHRSYGAGRVRFRHAVYGPHADSA